MRKLIAALLLISWATLVNAAPTSVTVPGDYASISAAITAVESGSTITLTSNGPFTEDLVVTKTLNVQATPGLYPSIYATGVVNPMLQFKLGSDGTKFGSRSGGKIRLVYTKSSTIGTGASCMIKIGHTTGTTLTIENIDMVETSTVPATASPVTGILVDQTVACANTVNLNYVDMDLGRPTTYNAGYAPCFGIRITKGSANTSGDYAPLPVGGSGAPTWNLDHVRIRYYIDGAICPNWKYMTLNMRYCDIGVLSDSGIGTNNYRGPIAGIIQQAYVGSSFGCRVDCPYTCNIDRSYIKGPIRWYAAAFSSNGSTITITRSAITSRITSTGGGAAYAYGDVALFGPGSNYGTPLTTPQVVNIDHCDLLDLSTVSAREAGGLCKPARSVSYATQAGKTTSTLTVTNSNLAEVGSDGWGAGVKMTKGVDDISNFDYVNVRSLGANVGYTAGANDLALNPSYLGAATGNFNYWHTSVQKGDSAGKPLGVMADYSNISTLGPRFTLRYKVINGTANGEDVTSYTQQVYEGGDGVAVTAAAKPHYHWCGTWSDGTTNETHPASTNVTSYEDYTTTYVLDTYTINFAAGANGSITGTATQVVGWGESSTAVTAVADANYHFVQWNDGNTDNPRSVVASGDVTYTATFAINTYTYNYVAGVGGKVNGAASVTGTADHGANGPSVTAAPDTGFRFVKWLDNDSVNPTRQDVMTADFTTTATFEALVQHTLTYSAGSGGTITGTLSQTVGDGASGSEVVAVPDTGYHFVNWSDGNTNAARTETNVTGDISVTANFAINTYSVSYTAGTNGTITGNASQTVNYGGTGSEVVATPDTGYHFVSWSDGILTAARTDSNVTGAISVTATFAADSCTLTYGAGSGGTVTGSLSQTVSYGGNGTQVVATANPGYHFVNWSDGNTNAARTDTNVTANISVTANFAADFNPGTTIKVPTEYGTIQAAINAASEGGTVEIVNSAKYKENLRINKSVNLIASAGQTPQIEQLDNTTTNPVILGVTATPSNVRIGSLTGGRITFQYLKWGIATGLTLPYGMIRVESTTGSTVLVENCDIISTGPTTYGMCSGIQHGQNPCSVTIRYTNINLNRGTYTAGGDSNSRCYAHGIDISNNGPTNGATISRRIPGPAYTLDHVRIKNYVRSGIWLHYTSMTLTASYIDVGTVGENFNAGTNMPWGPLVSFTAASSWTGRIDHSIFGGPLNYAAFGKIGPYGTSISLSRTAIIGGGGANAVYGGLDCGSNAVSTVPGNPIRLSIDHCDLVHMGTAPAAALVRSVANGTINLAITNSNIYSATAQAINLSQIASPNVFTSSYNNVYGVTANVGYTAGTGDLSQEPGYFNPSTGDMRYSNNTLKRSDSAGAAIGSNADFRDIDNIVIGTGAVNRARGWTMMK